MKYSTEIEINKPIDKVIELFDDPKNYHRWMAGLQSFELISGTQGQPGAKTRMYFKMGKREMEMTETVIKRNFPDEYQVSYEAKGGFNIVTNRFQKLDENRCKFINDQEFRFNNLMMKLFAFLMPGAFKKQSMKYLRDFKAFAESLWVPKAELFPVQWTDYNPVLLSTMAGKLKIISLSRTSTMLRYISFRSFLSLTSRGAISSRE